MIGLCCLSAFLLAARQGRPRRHSVSNEGDAPVAVQSLG